MSDTTTNNNGNLPGLYSDLMRPKPTGNTLVTLIEESRENQLEILKRGATRANARGAAGATAMAAAEYGSVYSNDLKEPILIDDIGVCVIPGDVGSAADIANTMKSEAGVEESRPEFYLFPTGPSFPVSDDANRTWGIHAVGADVSNYTGAGIKVAVLDTGFDLGHPDFQGRTVISQSFVAGEAVDDGNGHGTHCIGTAMGPTASAPRPRYGVATAAEIYVGKVLSNSGSGMEIDILAGMAWAINEGCQVISMSLGRRAFPGEQPSAAYERLGRRALQNGSLIVAAAGNDSDRQFGFISPVGAPANSPSIMAVAAIDRAGDVAGFSNGGVNPNASGVDIAAPGVAVFSSYPQPRTYETLNGTSMACPHVAGVAALFAESNRSLRGQALWDALVSNASQLSDPPRDVGKGLAQVPNYAGATS